METSQTIGAIGAALARAQLKMEPAPFDRSVQILTKKGGTFKFRYATLASVMVITKALAEQEIAVVHGAACENKNIKLTTMLVHSSGEWIKESLTIPLKPDEDGPKEIGGAISYARRYQLSAMAGVVSEEDNDQGTPEQSDHRPSSAKQDTPPRPAPQCVVTEPTPPEMVERLRELAQRLNIGGSQMISLYGSAGTVLLKHDGKLDLVSAPRAASEQVIKELQHLDGGANGANKE